MELDRKIRLFNIPSPSSRDPDRTSASMQSFVREHYKELSMSTRKQLLCSVLRYITVALMFLHRGFFAQALTDNPSNPLQSAHSQSFLTAYKCACAVLDTTRDHYGQKPLLIARIWRIWSNAFTASVSCFALIPTIRSELVFFFFPGHNWNSGYTYLERKSRAISLGETGSCMSFISERSRNQQ
jgi:hypothetical protein